MANGTPVARGQGWKDKEWKDFVKSGYDEKAVAPPKREVERLRREWEERR
jgi:hypothetical protein